MYDVHDHRGWWKRRWLGLVVGIGSVLTGAVVVTLVVVGPLFGRGVDIVTSIGLSRQYEFLWSYLRWPVAFVSAGSLGDHDVPHLPGRGRPDGAPGCPAAC